MPTAQTFADVLLAPGRGLARAAERRSYLPALLAATAAALLLAFALVPRLDYARAFDDQLERDPKAAERMSPHDREVALAQVQKLGAAATYGAAVAWPAVRAVAIACCLFVASRVVAARPPFPGLLAVASWGLLPLALKDLLSIPALLRAHGSVAAAEAASLVPSSLSALLPAGAHAALVAAAQALDLFSLWSVGLVALGTAQLFGDERRRGVAVVVGLWASYVLVVNVALPGLTRGGAG